MFDKSKDKGFTGYFFIFNFLSWLFIFFGICGFIITQIDAIKIDLESSRIILFLLFFFGAFLLICGHFYNEKLKIKQKRATLILADLSSWQAIDDVDTWLKAINKNLNTLLGFSYPLPRLNRDTIDKKISNETKELFINSIKKKLSILLRAQSDQNKSLYNELAIFSTCEQQGDDFINELNNKRAMYSTFYRSWPLRITIVILLISLGLVGFKVYELANLGIDAKSKTDEAYQVINKATNDLKALVKKAEEASSNAEGRLKIANDTIEISKVEINRRLNETVEIVLNNSKNNLNKELEKKKIQLQLFTSTQINLLEIDVLKSRNELQIKIAEMENIKKKIVSNSSKWKKRLLESLEKEVTEKKVKFLELLTAEINQSSKKSEESLKLSTQAMEDLIKKITASSQKWQKIEIELFENTSKKELMRLKHNLNTIVDNKIALLNSNTDLDVVQLNNAAEQAHERIHAVVSKVESFENSWLEKSALQEQDSNQRLLKIENKLKGIEDNYSIQLKLAKDIVFISSGITSLSEKYSPTFMANILEYKVTILVLSTLMFLFSLLLNILFFRKWQKSKLTKCS